MTIQTSDISVIICTYAKARWDDLADAVRSVQNQSARPLEIIVVIDHNPKLFERIQSEMPGIVAVENRGMQGASGARNSGVAVARGRVIAFLDDDAEALPDWLEQLCAGYENERVLGVGGTIEPLWLERRPRWFPEEFNWVIGGTYRGMPQVTAPVRNLWAGNMTVRREVFESVGGFRLGFGKVKTRSSPEDTDLCIRARQRWPQGVWLHRPQARVLHKVPASRATWHYYAWRCYNEGWGKAHLSSLVGHADGMVAERQHTFKTLPRGVAKGLVDAALRHDLTGLARAGAILIGLLLAAVGYVIGSFELRHVERDARPDGAEAFQPDSSLQKL